MRIEAIGARVLLVSCLASLAGCSSQMRVRTDSGSPASVAGPATLNKKAMGEDSAAYPYLLRIGDAVNRVEREPDAERVRIEFVRWSGSNYGRLDAIFRVTNPGDHVVVVWQVRQQVSVPLLDRAGHSWETQESDYPGHGWETTTIAGHRWVEFPMLSSAEGDWRVCLL